MQKEVKGYITMYCYDLIKTYKMKFEKTSLIIMSDWNVASKQQTEIAFDLTFPVKKMN